MSKLARQNVILEVVKEAPIGSQDELRRRLTKHGFHVNQTTLSRDIHEIGLVKTQEGYTLPSSISINGAAEAHLPSLNRLLREFVREVRRAQNLLVLKTIGGGSAQPVSAALDAEGWPEIVGTIAGDDAILIISSDNKTAQRLALRIQETLA